MVGVFPGWEAFLVRQDHRHREPGVLGHPVGCTPQGAWSGPVDSPVWPVSPWRVGWAWEKLDRFRDGPE